MLSLDVAALVVVLEPLGTAIIDQTLDKALAAGEADRARLVAGAFWSWLARA